MTQIAKTKLKSSQGIVSIMTGKNFRPVQVNQGTKARGVGVLKELSNSAESSGNF